MVGTYQYPPYMTLRNIQNIIFQMTIKIQIWIYFQNAISIKFLFYDSTAIIGHAYGYPSKSNSNNDFIAPVVKEFILKIQHL